MRVCFTPIALLLGAVLVAPQPVRAAEPKASDQTLVLRISALDDLIADLMYLAEIAGKKDEAEQLHGYLKSVTGDDGLKGLDPKKPIGVTVKVSEAIDRTAVVVMLPIADEKAFMDTLKKFNLDPEKDGDVYKLAPPGLPVAFYFRFANNYVYVTGLHPDHIDKDKLLAPAAALPAAEIGMASVLFNLDQIPATYKKLVLGQLGEGLGKAKANAPPGEFEAQKKLRIAMIDEFGDYVKSAINDGAAAALRLDLDRKTADLGLTFRLTAKPKSLLASGIEELGASKSVGASLVGADSAFSGTINLALPEKLRTLLGPVIDEAYAKGIEQETDKDKRAAMEKVFKALSPSVKAATFDAGFTLNGPTADKYTLLFGFRVKNGGDIDGVFKDLLKYLPAGERDKLKLDVDKAGSTAIHRADVDKLDAQARAAFGDNPHVYFAARDDAVLAALGDEKALAALKNALGSAPKVGSVLHAEASLLRLAPLMAHEQKGAVEASKKAFGDKKDSDKIVFDVEGGKVLKVRLSAKAQVIKFGALMDELRKKDL
jgi:hypothetical protein